jgi:hypothetical protein
VIAKDRRRRLFKKSKPFVRPFEKSDLGVLWAAYQHGAFGIKPGLEQEAFTLEMAKLLQPFPLLWVIEDDCKHFKKGRGQIALVGLRSDGWTFEPHPFFFPWARRKNVVRAVVNFFHMMWSKKDVGVCLVRCGAEQAGFLNHMKKFGVLYQRGRIPLGSPKGDVWIFSINGKRT